MSVISFEDTQKAKKIASLLKAPCLCGVCVFVVAVWREQGDEPKWTPPRGRGQASVSRTV